MIARVGAIVIVHALVQAALVWSNPVPEWRWGFEILALASFLALVAALWAIVVVLSGNRRLATLGATAGFVIAVGAAAVVLPVLAAVVAVVGMGLLATVVVRTDPLTCMRAHYRRGIVTALVSLLVILLGWLAVIALGFLVTGVVSAVLAWVLIGVLWTVLIRMWIRTVSD